MSSKAIRPTSPTIKFMGILYEEGGRGILANVTPEFTAKATPEEVAKHVHVGDWNDM